MAGAIAVSISAPRGGLNPRSSIAIASQVAPATPSNANA
jgi:hypothetical protein